jgi:hypothetical protein
MPTLQSKLSDIAQQFTSAILDAVKGTPLSDLIAEPGRRTSNGRHDLNGAAPLAAKRTRSAGRLPRRSIQDIVKALDDVVALVKRHPQGLRAEEIRQQLGMLPKEMPRVLKEGLSRRALKTKGQKRATTYFAK